MKTLVTLTLLAAISFLSAEELALTNDATTSFEEEMMLIAKKELAKIHDKLVVYAAKYSGDYFDARIDLAAFDITPEVLPWVVDNWSFPPADPKRQVSREEHIAGNVAMKLTAGFAKQQRENPNLNIDYNKASSHVQKDFLPVFFATSGSIATQVRTMLGTRIAHYRPAGLDLVLTLKDLQDKYPDCKSEFFLPFANFYTTRKEPKYDLLLFQFPPKPQGDTTPGIVRLSASQDHLKNLGGADGILARMRFLFGTEVEAWSEDKVDKMYVWHSLSVGPRQVNLLIDKHSAAYDIVFLSYQDRELASKYEKLCTAAIDAANSQKAKSEGGL